MNHEAEMIGVYNAGILVFRNVKSNVLFKFIPIIMIETKLHELGI